MIERYLYLCDQKKCKNCTYPICRHTEDIKHAKNKKGHVFRTDMNLVLNTTTHWEVEGEEK